MEIPCPDPNQFDGYLVVLKTDPAILSWRRWLQELDPSQSTESIDAYMAVLREELSSIRCGHYRGIQREAIDRWSESERSWTIRVPDQHARHRMWELLGPDPTSKWAQPPWFDADLLPTVEQAREIHALTEAPTDREIIRLTRGDYALTSRTLGFDIGYWGSDHFSLIGDTVVMPRWHPCPPDELPDLEERTLRLNENLLYPSASDAIAFRAWYLSRPWAEEESPAGQFEIIRVDSVS